MGLQLHSLSLYQFKNYFQQEFEFSERIVGICGNNGLGKTNLLDAVHYLCFTKSYFSRIDALNSLHGYKGFRVEGAFTRNGQTEKAVCIVRETGKKEFLVNAVPYSRFSQHIGHYPCVVIAPDDVQLIIGGSEERRQFLDTLLSQLDAAYLQALIQYTKILQQRNSFLRTYNDAFGGQRDLSVLDVLDEQLTREGVVIFEKRRSFLLSFLPVVKNYYNEIARRYEAVNLLYESELATEDFSVLLQQNRQKDMLLQRTSAGPHRDDLLFQLGAHVFKNTASQGQRKSLLFALKLAELDVILAEKRIAPLLLLDDVFEKLDEERIDNLLARVCVQNIGQVFITDTNGARLTEALGKLGLPFQIIQL